MNAHPNKRLRATVIVRMQEGILLAADKSGLVLLPPTMPSSWCSSTSPQGSFR